MLDQRLVDLIEKIGFITNKGVHIYGAAAVSYFTYATVEDLNQSAVTLGRKMVEHLIRYYA